MSNLKLQERYLAEHPDEQVFHLCIVNLVIGTLYCAKGNYPFGISRVMRSLEPYEKKLGAGWFMLGLCYQKLLILLTSTDMLGVQIPGTMQRDAFSVLPKLWPKI